MTGKDVLQALLRQDLVAFVHKVFITVYPATRFQPTWLIEARVHELMEIERGANHRLIINQPPRSLKSLCISIAYVAWKLGHNPGLRIVVVSYSSELAEELHRQFRLVTSASWYKELFRVFRISRDTGTELITSKNGGRLALSVGGSFTGRGADLAVIDDPQKEDDGFSDIARKRTIEWLTGTLFSRLNDKARTPIILVQQRLHEDDASGYLLRQPGWRVLKLPAIATEREVIALGSGRFHTREEGEPLHPAREGLAVLRQIRSDKGSLLFSAHYQQEPVPLGGNLVKREWFKFFDTVPKREPGVRVVQSWDIASQVGDANDYSVCLTALVIKQDYYIVDVWRGRLQYPDLRRKVISLAQQHSARTIIIEDAGPGQLLLQDLRLDTPAGMERPIGKKPEGSKIDRMATQSARIEAGRVHVLNNAIWLLDFLSEVLAFPYGRHDDQVDALSQLLAWGEWSRVHEPTVSIFGPIVFRDGVQITPSHWDLRDAIQAEKERA